MSCVYMLLYCRWLTVSADQIVVLILLLALAVKFVLFENREDQLIPSENMASSADATEISNGKIICIIPVTHMILQDIFNGLLHPRWLTLKQCTQGG